MTHQYDSPPALMTSFALFQHRRPGFIMQGGLSDRIDFPQWFGKNSSKTKFKRFLGVLGHHMRSQTSVDRADLRMNYLPYLRKHLVYPLAQGTEGAEKVISMMDQYVTPSPIPGDEAPPHSQRPLVPAASPFCHTNADVRKY